MQTKACSKCKKILLVEMFGKDSSQKSGLRCQCKNCRKEYKWKTKEQYRKWRREYDKKNRKRINRIQKGWRKKNKEHCAKWASDYKKQKRLTDPNWQINECMRGAIRKSLKGNKCFKKWKELVEYDIETLRKHLESQFDDKMNWNNYGSYWHVDHITPMSWFKFTYPEDEEFRKCWALENLQPLEASENQSKSNRFISKTNEPVEVK